MAFFIKTKIRKIERIFNEQQRKDTRVAKTIHCGNLVSILWNSWSPNVIWVDEFATWKNFSDPWNVTESLRTSVYHSSDRRVVRPTLGWWMVWSDLGSEMGKKNSLSNCWDHCGRHHVIPTTKRRWFRVAKRGYNFVSRRHHVGLDGCL